MLEAIDIVLICLGTILSLLALIIIPLLFIARWWNSRKQPFPVANGRLTREQPMFSKSLRSGAVTNAVVPLSSVDKQQKIVANGTSHPNRNPANLSMNSAVGVVDDDGVEWKTHGTLHESRASHSIKRSHRPCKIRLSIDRAKAAQVEAIQTEHAVHNFIEDLQRIRNGGDSVLYEEFQILELWDSAREKSCCAAENARTRNRFVDILPFIDDDSRVILRGPNNYINASLIDGHRSSGQFIATQGPIGPEETRDGKKESTVGRRLLADDLGKERAMRADADRLRRKYAKLTIQQRCSQYWPSQDETRWFGAIEVDLVSECKDSICIQRELSISNGSERRQVSQFHFLNWSDAHGPENTVQLLDFINRVACKKFSKPIVVHCSAGVGRTGVLIALWRLLEQARHDKLIDVFGAVDALRQQRSRMVQTPEQYLSLYEALSFAILDQRL